VLVNDARAFTLAEAMLGAGRGAETVVCFTVGTGIGGGIIFHGRLHLGFDGAAGELGHQTIEPDGPLCGCGNRGCLEALAGGYAISGMGVQAAQDDPESPIYMLAGGDMRAVTPEVIMRAAKMGDEVARRIIERAGYYLGIGVSNAVTMLSADCVVIGGGVSQLGEWLLNPIRATLRERCHTVALDRVKIVLSALGQDAGVIGAALWASQKFG
jgi:glucokinase